MPRLEKSGVLLKWLANQLGPSVGRTPCRSSPLADEYECILPGHGQQRVLDRSLMELTFCGRLVKIVAIAVGPDRINNGIGTICSLPVEAHPSQIGLE